MSKYCVIFIKEENDKKTATKVFFYDTELKATKKSILERVYRPNNQTGLQIEKLV